VKMARGEAGHPRTDAREGIAETCRRNLKDHSARMTSYAEGHGRFVAPLLPDKSVSSNDPKNSSSNLVGRPTCCAVCRKIKDIQ